MGLGVPGDRPDVFGEQLAEPGYEQVERIAAVALTVTRHR